MSVDDMQVAENIKAFKQLQHMRDCQLVTDHDLLDFMRTHPMNLETLPRVQPGDERSRDQMNQLIDRINALSILYGA